ncbi:putative zinc-binding metallopeptidase [Sporosarcina luteola]|uniref:putative zinc-binding metallopeptidase n=1 Tax=Sporosarcina luteola TaxID=582850 RepID=UPI002040D312|nr:putative zinc-binding metallopeptidase [Sporosarcina luteola]MCM3638903.1 putative zinc-binding metallopeptidase [Sporosarcina luteola]
MGVSKGMIMGVFAAIMVSLAGCEEEEKAIADLVETEIVEEVHQVDEPVVDEYWSQPIDSEICQTVGECRDVGDANGSDYFTSFSGDLKQTNNMSYLNVQAVGDESVLAFSANDKDDEKSIIACYELIEDEFVLTKGEETTIFNGIADIVLALYDRDKMNLQILEFQENVYPNVNTYEGKLVLPSNLVQHWLQSSTVAILVHEYGHMLTWNKADLVNSYTCPADQFHLKLYWECYNADSYMNLYYQAFLKEYEEQWLDAGNKTVEERMAFYESNKDSFVSTYATVNPYEDIAESFAHFMLTPYNESPQTVPETKVNFFYQFPELVEYRAFVLKELKDRKDEMWSFY